MEVIIYIIVAAVASAIITFLIARNRLSVIKILLKNKTEEYDTDIAKLNEEKKQLLTDIAKLQTIIDNKTNDKNELVIQNNILSKELEILNEHYISEKKELQDNFEMMKKLMIEQVQNDTETMLKNRENSLLLTNNQYMDNIIKPLKDKIEELTKSMIDNRDISNQNTTQIKTTIEEMMKHTNKIGDEANRLADALKNDNKIQGNWGEMLLETILEKSGLTEGENYMRQYTIRDENYDKTKNDDSGKNMIVDVLLFYPNGKKVVIDSKVSLSAYEDYCNAENTDNKDTAIKHHIESIKKHVEELKNKQYNKYIDQALEYVIMFVPNDNALQLALNNDHDLWRKSFESGIFITSEQNLFAILRLIQIAWNQDKQINNQKGIIDLAQKILDRITDFSDIHKKLGEKLQVAITTYNDSCNKLYNSNQSVVKTANRLAELGATTSNNKHIPQTIVKK